ncbi:TPA: restriction endonuclease [Klebsiella quasipneumoniae subsp. quasipneumoniae]|nr:restriction endonuclease [Klebsiella quasipneumoniae subsp. quasipneumoniae]
MSVPTYDNFIEPVLRVLQQSPTGVAAKEVYEGAANLLHLDERSIFITTSSFTAHAVEFSRSVEGLVLIDGNRLVNLMMDNEVGVASQQIKLPKIDMDYFEQ